MNSNRRPKPTISYFENFNPVAAETSQDLTPQKRVSRISAFEEAEKKLDHGDRDETKAPLTQILNATTSKRNKKFLQVRNWISVSLILVAVLGIAGWNESVQSHKAAVQTLEDRNVLAAQCFKINDEDRAAKSGSIGSIERENAVVAFYDEVIKSKCVEWGDGSIFNNPFYEANEKSWNWQALKNAFSYSLQRWNGLESISLRCADGWNSPSIGKSGACSHHGGVVTGFNEFHKWNLINQISPGQAIYPSISSLSQR
jgi:hypothetical protein